VDAKEGGICVYVSGEMDFPCAFVTPNKSLLDQTAAALGITSTGSALLADAKLLEHVRLHLNAAAGPSLNLKVEALAAVVLVEEPWTPENGCLTAANKLNRQAVQKRCTSHIKQWEASSCK
jgi:long-chain acyl-CoA synthetase